MAGIDWGFLGAVSGRRNFNALREGRLRELAAVSEQNAMLQQQVGREQASQQAFLESITAIEKLPVLEPGMKRIRKLNEKLIEEDLATSLLESGGNAYKWFASVGKQKLSAYLKKIENDPLVKQELLNNVNYKKYLADKEKGLVERRSYDPVTGTFSGGFESKLADYQAGKTDKLDYAGAFKASDYVPSFDKNYKDPANPYKGGVVTPQDIMNDFMMKNKGKMSDADLFQSGMMIAQNYVDMVNKGANPLHWKQDHLTPLQQKQMQYLSLKIAEKQGVGNNPSGSNSLVARAHAGLLPLDPIEVTDKDGNVTGVLSVFGLNSPETMATAQMSGFTDKKGVVNKNSPAIKSQKFRTIDGREVSFKNIADGGIKAFEPYSQIVMLPQKTVSGKEVQVPYLRYRVTLDEDKGAERTLINGQPLDKSWWFGSSIDDIPELSDDGFFTFNRHKSLDILVPFDDTPENRTMVEDESGRFTKWKSEQYQKEIQDTAEDNYVGGLTNIVSQ